MRLSDVDTWDRTPPPLLPVSPLAAPTNTGVSLPLQLIKAAVPAESHFHRDLRTPAMSTESSQGRCRTLSFLLTCFSQCEK